MAERGRGQPRRPKVGQRMRAWFEGRGADFDKPLTKWERMALTAEITPRTRQAKEVLAKIKAAGKDVPWAKAPKAKISDRLRWIAKQSRPDDVEAEVKRLRKLRERFGVTLDE